MQETYEMQVWSLGWEDPLSHGNPLQNSCLETHGMSLAGYILQNHKESDTAEATCQAQLVKNVEVRRNLILIRLWIKRSFSLLLNQIQFVATPLDMYGCESWTIKKAERRRIDAFELWYWRRLLRVPWTTRRSNQSILKEICPGCSLEGLMLKLKV